MLMTYKVVILDDEPWSRQLVKSLIEWDRLGLVAAGEADDGESGLTLISELAPDIVITDMRMPGMDGTELLRALRVSHPDIRTLVMSGYDDFSLVREALKSHAVDYLLKPLDPVELNKVLSAIVRELDAETAALPVSLNTTVLFNTVGELKEYVSIRRRIFGHLLELDMDSIDTHLSALVDFLNDRGTRTLESDVLGHIAGDFLHMLEEFLSLNNGAGIDAVSDEAPLPVDDVMGLCDGIRRIYQSAIRAIIDDRSRRDHLDPQDVKDHIDRHFRDPISLESVARMFLISKEHLSRVFRKTFNATVNEYITSLRMERARYLITEEEIEIKQVAYLTGYSELPYFYRVFKKYFGLTPGQIRQIGD